MECNILTNFDKTLSNVQLLGVFFIKKIIFIEIKLTFIEWVLNIVPRVNLEYTNFKQSLRIQQVYPYKIAAVIISTLRKKSRKCTKYNLQKN